MMFSVVAFAEDFDPFLNEDLPEVKARPNPAPAAPSAPRQAPPPASRSVIPGAQSTRPKMQLGEDKNSVKTKTQKPRVSTYIPPVRTPELKLDVTLENNNTASYLKPAFDVAKYTFDAVRFPVSDVFSNFRPTLKFASGRVFLLSSRPIIEIRNTLSQLQSGKTKSRTEVFADLAETSATITASSRFSLTVGQENFQWGMAEMSGPSNFIFRASELAESLVRTPLSRVKTRKTARLNFSNGQSFNVVTIAEFEPEKRTAPSFFSGRRFLLKPEYSWNSGADFLGLVIGGAETLKYPFLGGYFAINIGDALGVYVDSGHFKGSDILKPVKVTLPSAPAAPPVIAFAQPDLASDKMNHEVLLGLRYTFENGVEVKFEGFSNTAGYSQSDVTRVQQMYEEDSPLFPLFFTPNAESRAQKSVMFAVRNSNFGKRKNISMIGRYLKPILDEGSGAGVLYSEYGLNDNTTLYLAAGGYHGPFVSESTLTHRFVITLGHKYVW